MCEHRDTETKRIGWIAGMDKQELERSGSALLAMLLAAATHRQMQLQDLASALGVTYSYLAQLRSGYRKIINVSEDFLTHSAQFLEVPRMAVLLACGRVQVSDFYAAQNIQDKIEHALRFIQSDGVIGASMPSTVFMLDKDIQLFIVDLYQKVTHRNLLGQPITYQEMNEYAALSVSPGVQTIDGSE